MGYGTFGWLLMLIISMGCSFLCYLKKKKKRAITLALCGVLLGYDMDKAHRIVPDP